MPPTEWKDPRLGKKAIKLMDAIDKTYPPGRPAFSEKIDKWINDHLDPILLAIPFGTTIIWGIGIFLAGVLIFECAKRH